MPDTLDMLILKMLMRGHLHGYAIAHPLLDHSRVRRHLEAPVKAPAVLAVGK